MERLGRITTSLPDLPLDRRMTYGAMRRAIIGLPVTRIQRHTAGRTMGLLRQRKPRHPDRPSAHLHGETLHFGARTVTLAARRHRLCER